MSDNRAIKHLAEEIESVINRFRQEYDISYAAAIGVLVMVAIQLFAEEGEDG